MIASRASPRRAARSAPRSCIHCCVATKLPPVRVGPAGPIRDLDGRVALRVLGAVLVAGEIAPAAVEEGGDVLVEADAVAQRVDARRARGGGSRRASVPPTKNHSAPCVDGNVPPGPRTSRKSRRPSTVRAERARQRLADAGDEALVDRQRRQARGDVARARVGREAKGHEAPRGRGGARIPGCQLDIARILACVSVVRRRLR